MAEVNVSNLDYALKRLYSDRKVATLAFTNHPFLAKIRKNTRYSGSAYAVPIIDSDVQGASHDFTNAYNYATGTTGAQFLVTVKEDYVVALISGKAIAVTKYSPDNFVDTVTHIADSAFRKAGRRLAIELYGDGTGKLGAVSSITNSVVTLSDAETVLNFSVGQTLDFYTGSSKSATRPVTAVNYDAGTITLGGSGTVTAGDDIYNVGDYGNAVKGWLAWNPTSAPTSGDSFFGVDRSVNPAMRAGHRITVSGSTIAEKIIEFGNSCAKFGCAIDTIFMHPVDFGTLAAGLHGNVVYQESPEDKQLGLRSLKLWVSTGAVDVYPDPAAAKGRIYGCRLDVWELLSAGPTPGFLHFANSGKIVDTATSDAVVMKVGGYHQLVCYDTSQIATAALS